MAVPHRRLVLSVATVWRALCSSTSSSDVWAVLGGYVARGYSYGPVRGHLDGLRSMMVRNVYIGRGSSQRGLARSRWCNDFKVAVYGRDHATAQLVEKLVSDDALRARLWSCSGATLVCHCIVAVGPDQKYIASSVPMTSTSSPCPSVFWWRSSRFQQVGLAFRARGVSFKFAPRPLRYSCANMLVGPYEHVLVAQSAHHPLLAPHVIDDTAVFAFEIQEQSGPDVQR